jgi:hypothetical protein
MTRKSLMFSESYDLNYSCLLLYVPVHVFHQRCVHMHKVLRPVITQGVCHWHRSLATWIVVSFKEAIYICQETYVLVLCLCSLE